MASHETQLIKADILRESLDWRDQVERRDRQIAEERLKKYSECDYVSIRR